MKYRCAACKSACAERPVAPEVKLEPEIKQEPFTIRGSSASTREKETF
jgi:hypothetical protein